MKTLLLITLGWGVVLGLATVALIWIYHWGQTINSLSSPQDALGCWGTVEVPFDHTNRGKVRVNVKGSLVDLVACTDDRDGFVQGDRVLVVSVSKKGIWVVALPESPPSPLVD